MRVAAAKSGQVRTSSVKRQHPNKGKSYMPMPQQVRVMKKYVDGKSMRQIAKEEHKNPDTIARVVKSDEMQEYGKSLMEKILGRCGDKLMLRIEHEIEDWNTKNGAWVAMELAERFGAIPPRVNKNGQQPQSGASVPTEDEWIGKLILMAKEKGKIYGTRLPDVEEVMTKGELKKYEEELAEERE